MTTDRRADAGGPLMTVRGFLIMVVTFVAAGSAGVAAAFAAATKVDSPSAITFVVAIAAGLAATVTTAVVVASGLHRLIGHE